MTVGIHDLNVYASTLAVNALDIAEARSTPPESITSLDLLRRSMVPSFEDPVTLAANAARPIVEMHGARKFGLLILATESSVDYAKPLSAYVHRHLGLPESCFHVEVKHACFAGTAALHLAADWVRANPGRLALVVTTDMVRKLFGHPAEPAEGAGATAIAIGEDPDVLVLDGASGFAAREIYDVTRPTPTKEVIRSELSLSAYLDLLEASWEDYRSKPAARSFDELRFILFHTPLVPLVRQAHALLHDLAEAEGSPAAGFERQVAPSLGYCREIGNIYSGTLYVALAGLIDSVNDLAPGTPVGLFSYGSGSCSAFFSGTIGERARVTIARHGIAARLERRRRISVPAYEALMDDAERSLIQCDYVPDDVSTPGLREDSYRNRDLLVLTEVRDHYRNYDWL